MTNKDNLFLTKLQQELLKICEPANQEDLDATQLAASMNHRYLANLHKLKLRHKDGKSRLDSIEPIEKLVSNLLNCCVDINY